MTLRYTDMNQHDALYKTARNYPGGLNALARRMGISEHVLRNKLSPGVGSHYPSFEEVSEIVEYLQEAKVADATLALQAANWRHGLCAFAMPSCDALDDGQLLMTVCRTMKQVGAVAAAVSDAMADGKITLDEMDRIEREFQDAFAALAQWHARVRAKHESGQVFGRVA